MPGVKYLGAGIFSIVMASIAFAEEAAVATVVGTAYDQKSGNLLYTEQHFCNVENRLCTVEYRDNFGAMIAQKHLDFSESLIGPSLVMTDYRQAIELSFPASEVDDMVVDAGFDNYVRSKWDELFSGSPVRFPFLVVGFDKPLNMRANREDTPGCDDDKLCLSISLDSWLLGMLTDPIELSYSRDSRRLLRFSGMSNIKGAAGETLTVDIDYSYENDVHLVGPLQQPDASDFSF
jgi:hypothetical protein